MELSSQNLIAEVRELWNTGRKVMVEVAARLQKLRDSDVWKDSRSFPQWVESELEIGQSQTSKLLAIADYYLPVYSAEEIGTTDYEKLYLSAKLPGTPEENLAKAKVLSRGELKSEKQELAPHTPDFKSICVFPGCWTPEESHN